MYGSLEELERDLEVGPSKYGSKEWERWRQARNTCKTCLTHEYAVQKNYDMMWGEADLYCSRCDRLIRYMDFG